MKRHTDKIPQISTRVYYKLIEITLQANSEEEARNLARNNFFKMNLKKVSNGFYVDVTKQPSGEFKCTVFDYYTLEALSVSQYIRHIFRKWLATAKIKIGINPCVVIVSTPTR